MPTELPIRRIARPAPSPEGSTLVLVVGILLMLVVGAALLLHPEDVAAESLTAPAQTL